MAKNQNSFSVNVSALQAAEAKVAKLREKLAVERREQIKELHSEFGFESRQDLVDALIALGGVRRARVAGASPAGRSRRGRITPEMKAGIIKALKANTPGAAVAEQFGISLPSVHNIKKAAGLVNSRKKKAKKK